MLPLYHNLLLLSINVYLSLLNSNSQHFPCKRSATTYKELYTRIQEATTLCTYFLHLRLRRGSLIGVVVVAGRRCAYFVTNSRSCANANYIHICVYLQRAYIVLLLRENKTLMCGDCAYLVCGYTIVSLLLTVSLESSQPSQAL